jgi:hypothetical protein
MKILPILLIISLFSCTYKITKNSAENNNEIDRMLINSELNEKQKEIYINLIGLSHSIYQDEHDDNYLRFDELKEQSKALLIAFLQTDINWDEDIAKKIPFIDSFDISDDELLKIYNLKFETRGTGDWYDHLLQYKTKSSSIITEPDFLYFAEYSIFTLKDNLYLLKGARRAGGMTEEYAFTTVQIINDKIITYPAFNGNHSLAVHCSSIEDRARFEDCYFNTTKENIYIELTYHNGNTMKLVFNGVEFSGEYGIFND